MTPHVIAWNDVPATSAPGGVTKRHVALEGVSLVTVSIPAGTEAPRHSHDHEQFVQVISGSGTLTTEQGTPRLRARQPSSSSRPKPGIRPAFETETVLVETNVSTS